MLKKRMIMIGIVAVLAVLLAVGSVLLSRLAIPEPEPGVLDGYDAVSELTGFGFIESENISVFRFAPENVDYLEVKNNLETYRVRLVDGDVKIVGYETVPLLAASAKGLFDSVQSLRLETVIAKDCEDMDDYGLAEPAADVTIRSRSDTSVTFHIGDPTADGEYYYMSVDGQNTVYLISELRAERYLKSIVEYCDRKIYKTFVPYDDFVALSIESPDRTYKFRIANEEELKSGVYFGGIAMDLPFAHGADSDKIETLMSSMVSLVAKSVAQVCVTEQDLAQYGLDAAHCTKVVLSVYADPNPTMYNNQVNPYHDSSKPTGVYQDFDVTYRIGATVDGTTYVMFEDIPVVYCVAKDVFAWSNWAPYQFSSKILLAEYINEMASVLINTPDRKLTFALKNAESKDLEELIVTCGGVSVNNNDFRTFYGNLISIYPSGDATGFTPSGEAYLEIVYVKQDGTQRTLAFYPMGEGEYVRQYAVSVDGEPLPLCVNVTEIEKVLSDTQKLLDGREVRG